MTKKVKFGVIADVHMTLTPDVVERMAEFLEDCRKEDVDFIIHLGDFTWPPSRQLRCLDYSNGDKILSMFNGFEKPSYHVIGNHDCDYLLNKQELLNYWQSKNGEYYSFDMCGFHFVVLDCNFVKCEGNLISLGRDYYEYIQNGGKSGEQPYIPDEEIKWLEKDLAATPYPSVIFSHQRLSPGYDCLKNGEELRKVIDSAPNKVLISLNGHEHIDEAEKFADTWYYNVNSMSSYWVGEDYAVKERKGKEADENHPFLCCTVPYSKGPYAIVTIDEDGVAVKGVQGEFVGPSPREIGIFNGDTHFTRALRVDVTPSIEDRYMPFK